MLLRARLFVLLRGRMLLRLQRLNNTDRTPPLPLREGRLRFPRPACGDCPAAGARAAAQPNRGSKAAAPARDEWGWTPTSGAPAHREQRP
ncbi:hypothetical protein GCM10027440_28730 [Nocardiopsis coralliicola]